MTEQPISNVTPLAKVSVSTVIVTPEIATRWLASNTFNRKLRPAKVARYASDMAAGRWTVDASMICFDTQGRLMNGQHRLHAIVASGASIPFVVMRNTPDEAMATMDTGALRTGGDFFGLSGYKNAHLTSSSARLAIIYSDGRIYKDRKTQDVSTIEQEEFLDANPDLLNWVDVSSHLRKNIDAPPTVIAVAGWLFSRHAGDEAAVAFLNALATRARLDLGDPILTLDTRLRNIRDRRTSLSHRDYLHLFVKTWNYHRRGTKKVAQINLPRPGDRIPEVRR